MDKDKVEHYIFLKNNVKNIIKKIGFVESKNGFTSISLETEYYRYGYYYLELHDLYFSLINYKTDLKYYQFLTNYTYNCIMDFLKSNFKKEIRQWKIKQV